MEVPRVCVFCWSVSLSQVSAGLHCGTVGTSLLLHRLKHPRCLFIFHPFCVFKHFHLLPKCCEILSSFLWPFITFFVFEDSLPNCFPAHHALHDCKYHTFSQGIYVCLFCCSPGKISSPIFLDAWRLVLQDHFFFKFYISIALLLHLKMISVAAYFKYSSFVTP